MKSGGFWTEVIKHKKTFWRATIYEFTKSFFSMRPDLQKKADVLELGGSIHASHQRALPKAWNISYADYVSGPEVTHVFDANKTFPIESGAYTGCIAYNTLLHIEHVEHAIEEMIRISTSFVLYTMPFASPVAHHPVDWNRYTKARLENHCQYIKQKGLITSYEVLEIGGMFGVVAHILDLVNKYRIIRVPVYALCRLADRYIYPKVKTQCPMQLFVYMQK